MHLPSGLRACLLSAAASLALVFPVITAAEQDAGPYRAVLAADLSPVDSYSFLGYLTPYDGRLFFTVSAESDEGVYSDLGVYDPAAGVASIAADLNAHFIHTLKVFDGRLFFVSDDGITGEELWSFDAQTEEAHVVDIVPGVLGSQPAELTPYDGRLFMRAAGAGIGRELLVYDAATNSASIAADVWPGEDESYPEHLTVYDDRLFFRADGPDDANGGELWAYDAATGAASRVADIRPGGLGSGPGSLTIYEDKLFFAAVNDENRELWAYDRATDRAELSADLNGVFESNPFGLTVYDGRLFYAADLDEDDESPELVAFDAATGGASLAADVHIALDPSTDRRLTVFDGRLFFAGFGSYDEGEEEFVDEELWSYDAATGESAQVLDLNPGIADSDPSFLTVHEGTLYFFADDGTHGSALWMILPVATGAEIPANSNSIHLEVPYPNPSRETLNVAFHVTSPAHVRLEVFDMLGRRVAALVDGMRTGGNHTVILDTSRLSSGGYLIRLQAGDGTVSRVVTVTR